MRSKNHFSSKPNSIKERLIKHLTTNQIAYDAARSARFNVIYYGVVPKKYPKLYLRLTEKSISYFYAKRFKVALVQNYKLIFRERYLWVHGMSKEYERRFNSISNFKP